MLKKLKQIFLPIIGIFIFVLSFNVTQVFANDIELENNITENLSLNLDIDFNSSETYTYIIDNYEITVANVPTFSRSFESDYVMKNVTIRDIISDAYMGTINIYASYYYDGRVADVTTYSSYITSTGASSDLKVNGTYRYNNYTSKVTITTEAQFTSLGNGKTTYTYLNLYIYNDGSCFA